MMRPFIPPAVRILVEPPPADVEAEPVDPCIGVREAAFAEGYAAGHRTGHAAGAAEAAAAERSRFDAELATVTAALEAERACNTVVASLADILAKRDQDRADLHGAARACMAEALRLLFPRLMERAVGEEILALVLDALALRPQEGLTLRASPATLDAVRALPIATTDLARLAFVPDPDRPEGQAEIAWTGGGLTFAPEILLRQVTDALCPLPSAGSPPGLPPGPPPGPSPELPPTQEDPDE